MNYFFSLLFYIYNIVDEMTLYFFFIYIYIYSILIVTFVFVVDPPYTRIRYLKALKSKR